MDPLVGVNNPIEISYYVLNQLKLKTCSDNYEIAETEYYYWSPKHLDPFVHCSPEQQIPGQIYFHKAGNKPNAKYKGGTFKGMDLTFGLDKSDYGGMLIRSIYSPNKGLIEGPSKVVDTLLRDNNVNRIEDLYTVSIEFEQDRQNNVYIGPRIGLTLKKDDQRELRENFDNVQYRFTSTKNVKKLKSSLYQLY